MTTRSSDEVACPRCGGMGWRDVRWDVRDPKTQLTHTAHDYPDCSTCSGTGVVTVQVSADFGAEP